jgi:hypothetical protein
MMFALLMQGDVSPLVVLWFLSSVLTIVTLVFIHDATATMMEDVRLYSWLGKIRYI